MFEAEFDIFPETSVHVGQFLVFSCQGGNLFISFINLVDPQPVGILSLVQNLLEIIVPHILSLRSLVVVHGLRFIFLRKGSDFSDIFLKSSELVLSIRNLSFQIANIFNSGIDVGVKSVVLILVGDDLFFEDSFFMFQLVHVFLEVVYFPLDIVIVELVFLDIGA